MIDNHEEWLAEIARRKDEALVLELEKEQKRIDKIASDALIPEKYRYCAQLGCTNKICTHTNALKRINEKTWRKCNGKKCKIWGCPDHFDGVAEHENTCSKIIL